MIDTQKYLKHIHSHQWTTDAGVQSYKPEPFIFMCRSTNAIQTSKQYTMRSAIAISGAIRNDLTHFDEMLCDCLPSVVGWNTTNQQKASTTKVRRIILWWTKRNASRVKAIPLNPKLFYHQIIWFKFTNNETTLNGYFYINLLRQNFNFTISTTEMNCNFLKLN